MLSRRATNHFADKEGGFYICLDPFFSKKEKIIIESFSRGILTLKVPHASALFSIESKKEKILLCFKQKKIPVKKIICRV